MNGEDGRKMCLLDDSKVCDECGECTRCDLDPNKLCDNCMKCIKSDADYLAVEIDEVLSQDGEMFAPSDVERAALKRVVEAQGEAEEK